MKITSIHVENFRAISDLTLSNLSNAVVLAGPNGSGKSCVLDALRLLKSAYGSYERNECQQWFSEFQVGLRRGPASLGALFRDATKEVRLSATFSVSEEERAYVRQNAERLLHQLLRRASSPNDPSGLSDLDAGHFFYANRSQMDEAAAAHLSKILAALDEQEIRASVVITPDGDILPDDNTLLELIFSTYEPDHLGVIDYHGPHRQYGREGFDNINLTIESASQRSRQHALYNYNNKYSNLKTEMGSAYIRHMLAKQADASVLGDDSLTEALKELFTAFFPGKKFLGPKPTSDGRLLFPVQLANGIQHDINDLSSGEKEILYGYLRIHNSAPRNSIILIDEPELHLNPRLISGLASFYYRHLAQRNANQLWLVTHSDTMIREAVATREFSVFHIHSDNTSATGQATPVRGTGQIEKLIIELIGNLAAYRPGARIVVFESTEDPAFDMRMTCTLFPEFERQANCISAGDKRRVADLYDLLEGARQAGHVPGQFFSITDLDDEEPVPSSIGQFRWDVYHIENYLLDPKYILKALHEIDVRDRLTDDAAVRAALQACAFETIPQIVQHRLRNHVRGSLMSSIDLHCDPNRGDAAKAIAEAVVRSCDRVAGKADGELGLAKLTELETCWRNEYQAALTSDAWIKRFRGRNILKRFVGKFANGLKYEMFRQIIISRMRDDGFQPSGMETVVRAILSASPAG